MTAKTTAVLIALVLIAGIAVAAAFLFVGRAPQVVPSQSASQTVSVSCSITGAPVGGELHVLSDSGNPIAGAQVKGSSTAYCNGQPQVITLPVVTTNSSGWF